MSIDGVRPPDDGLLLLLAEGVGLRSGTEPVHREVDRLPLGLLHLGIAEGGSGCHPTYETCRPSAATTRSSRGG